MDLYWRNRSLLSCGTELVDSCSSDVYGCVDISIVDRIAFWTGPFTDIKSHLVYLMAAAMTGLRCRLPLVYLDHGLSSPVGFVFDLADEL